MSNSFRKRSTLATAAAVVVVVVVVAHLLHSLNSPI